MNLSKRQATELTRAVWNQLAKTGDEVKPTSIEWEGKTWAISAMLDRCPCCEYVQQIPNNVFGPGGCDHCPLVVDAKNQRLISCLGGLYMKWVHAKTVEGNKMYAKLIAELPERETVEWDITEEEK